LSAGGAAARAVVPFELDGRQSTQLQVEVKGVKSAPVTIPVRNASPGIITNDLTGKGQAVAIQVDSAGQRQNGPTGVEKGGILVFFATGAGQTIPAGVTGQLSPGTGGLRLPVQATIGGKTADVLYAGPGPGPTAGIAQFNVRVPADAPSGTAVPIAVTIDGVKSQDGPTAAIK